MGTETTQQQECMMTEPQNEHKWLDKFVGEWTYEGEAKMGQDKPMEKFNGVESVRSLGGLWILAEGKGEMPGMGEAKMLLTVGFDTQKKRYVGTWIGSMMTHLWVYEGELDSAGKVLTLNTEGPDMAKEGRTVKFKDMVEFKSDDRREWSSFMQGADGKWNKMMSATYRRKK